MTASTSPSRTVHFWVAALIIIPLTLLAIIFQDLRSSPDRVLATIGSGFGIFATIFAIIELLRLRTVTDLVKTSVTDATNKINDLSNIKNNQDCQNTIDRLTSIIESGEESPLSLIKDLVRQYSFCFPNEMRDPESEHRINRTNLEMFCAAVTKPERRAATQKLNSTVLSITAHLSVATAATINKN